MRVGQGFDVHAFEEGRKLILGGVEIPHTRGLAGHSDADVLLHAIIDAVLGALSLGDLGALFPDDDKKYKDISSAKLFSEVWNKAESEGYRLGNCDSTVIAQQPKLRPHVDKIRESIAECFGCDLSKVSVKATTTERLGFVGREEGIAAVAIVLLERA